MGAQCKQGCWPPGLQVNGPTVPPSTHLTVPTLRLCTTAIPQEKRDEDKERAGHQLYSLSHSLN